MTRIIDDTAIAEAAYNAGFRGDDLPLVVAIALRESGGNVEAHNSTPPDDSYGLMQINYYGRLRESRTAQFGPPEGLYDPGKNMQAAWTLSGGGKTFRPWSTYSNQTYRVFLPRAIKAVGLFSLMTGSNTQFDNSPDAISRIVIGAVNAGATVGNVIGDAAGKVGDVVTAPLKGIEAVGAFFAALLRKDTWFRILEVSGGAGLVLVGIALMNRDAIAQVAPAAAAGAGGIESVAAIAAV